MVVKKSSQTLHQLLEESKKREMTFEERSKIIWKEFVHDPTPDSIIIGKYDSIGLEQR